MPGVDSTAPAQHVRPTAAAGRFYPGDPQRLRETVRALLAEAAGRAQSHEIPLPPKAMIAPHAGYPYSGPIAASAYATLMGAQERIERVVLVGPAHFVPVAGLAVSSAQAFDTPLGPVPLDIQAIEQICRLEGVNFGDRPHGPEHSLEVHLPFLLEALGQFKLVPLVCNQCPPSLVATALEALWDGPQTLIVVSSDLSHYQDYAAAQRMDRATSQAIERLDPQGIAPEQACGQVAIAGLLTVARRRGLKAQAIDVRTSGDTAGGKDQVVGYGAYIFG